MTGNGTDRQFAAAQQPRQESEAQRECVPRPNRAGRARTMMHVAAPEIMGSREISAAAER
jgi:hypothetical protein